MDADPSRSVPANDPLYPEPTTWILSDDLLMNSKLNLCLFAAWATEIPIPHRAGWIQMLPVIHHTHDAQFATSCFNGMLFGKHSDRFRLRHELCARPGCRKCNTNNSMEFQWIGPWSHPAAIRQAGEKHADTIRRFYEDVTERGDPSASSSMQPSEF